MESRKNAYNPDLLTPQGAIDANLASKGTWRRPIKVECVDGNIATSMRSTIVLWDPGLVSKLMRCSWNICVLVD